ncbi:C2 family cysteine protease [Jiangella asiatica]|uniref:Calpain catalytic domain-containing protein n=1 Tax=Jiangella asiatica TaxID=2530372 RepID=A0A4R5DIP7_9ACTN|nr:C2 family cysteine protease [Jiangella asiatica]TDE11804.1 hypothetical protein E1269_08555 [Jiangella asiatica]
MPAPGEADRGGHDAARSAESTHDHASADGTAPVAGARPVAAAIADLGALRDEVRRQFRIAAADARPVALLGAPGWLADGLSEAGRRLAADLEAAAVQVGDSIAAEVERLRRVQHPRDPDAAAAPPTVLGGRSGRRPPGPPPPPRQRVPARPQVHPGGPPPGLAREPELTDGAGYARVPLTPPAVVAIDTPRQGRISDCHVIAAMCTLADRAPGLLTRLARAEGDLVVVDVPGRGYRLRSTLPVDGDGGGLAYARSPDGSTLVSYVEKAYAVYGGGYPKLGEGGYPAEALQWLTGQPSYMLAIARADDDLLTGLLGSGAPAVACSWRLDGRASAARVALRYGLAQDGHAYAVTGVVDGLVILHNPWGLRHPRPLPLDVFRTLFCRIDWCELDDN